MDSEQNMVESKQLQLEKDTGTHFFTVCFHMTWLISLIIVCIIISGYCSGISQCLQTRIQFNSAGLNNLIDLYKPLFQFLSVMPLSVGLRLAYLRSTIAMQQTTISQEQFKQAQKQFLHSAKQYEQNKLFDKRKEFHDYVKELKDAENHNFKSNMVKRNINAYTMINTLFNDNYTEINEKAKSRITQVVMDYHLLKAQIILYLSRRIHMEIDDEEGKILDDYDSRFFNLSNLAYFSFNNPSHGYIGIFGHINVLEDSIYIIIKTAAFCDWSCADIDQLLTDINEFREKLKEYCDPDASCDLGRKTLLAGVEAKRRPIIAERKKKSDDMMAKMGIQVPLSKSQPK